MSIRPVYKYRKIKSQVSEIAKKKTKQTNTLSTKMNFSTCGVCFSYFRSFNDKISVSCYNMFAYSDLKLFEINKL